MRYIIVPPEGGFSVHDTEGGEYWSDALTSAVGGDFDVVDLPSLGVDLWFHDEGKLIGLPVNTAATALFKQEYDTRDFIVGTVVLTGGVDDMGGTVGMTDEQISLVLDRFIKMG